MPGLRRFILYGWLGGDLPTSCTLCGVRFSKLKLSLGPLFPSLRGSQELTVMCSLVTGSVYKHT